MKYKLFVRNELYMNYELSLEFLTRSGVEINVVQGSLHFENLTPM